MRQHPSFTNALVHDFYIFANLCLKLYHQVRPDTETEEEKTVRESIQVWYGINAGPAHCHASSAAMLASVVMLLLLLNY